MVVGRRPDVLTGVLKNAESGCGSQDLDAEGMELLEASRDTNDLEIPSG
jgi:hypothetical protein